MRRTLRLGLLAFALLALLAGLDWLLYGGRVAPRPPDLYVLSERIDPATPGGSIARLRILDPSSYRLVNERPVGVNADVAVSRDGARLYVASVDPAAEQDNLIAIEPRRGATLWSIPIHDRVKYITGGPPALAVSPDGRWLYVHSYSAAPLPKGVSQIPYWLQIVDANTGRLLPATIPLPDCGAAPGSPLTVRTSPS